MQRISLSNVKLMNLFYNTLPHSISSYSYGDVNITCEGRILDQAEGTRLILYTNCSDAYCMLAQAILQYQAKTRVYMYGTTCSFKICFIE